VLGHFTKVSEGVLDEEAGHNHQHKYCIRPGCNYRVRAWCWECDPVKKVKGNWATIPHLLEPKAKKKTKAKAS
jgi:hypothetical protein